MRRRSCFAGDFERLDRKRHLRMEDQGNAGLPAALAPQTLSRSESPAGGQVLMRRRDFITLLGGAAAWPIMAHAQNYPSPPITIVVPAPARRPRGYCRALFAGAYAGIARPADNHRKRRRSKRYDRDRPRRASSPGWAHTHSRQLEQPDGGKRVLPSPI